MPVNSFHLRLPWTAEGGGSQTIHGELTMQYLVNWTAAAGEDTTIQDVMELLSSVIRLGMAAQPDRAVVMPVRVRQVRVLSLTTEDEYINPDAFNWGASQQPTSSWKLACVMQLHTAQAANNRRGRGRRYLAPPAENQVEGGVLSSRLITAHNDMWNLLRMFEVPEDPKFSAYTATMQIWSRANSSPNNPTLYPVTSVQCVPIVGTQRLRQDARR